MTSLNFNKSETESDDFDDFFDTADTSANDHTKQAAGREPTGKADPDRSSKTRNERRMSSDREGNTDYSSDALTHSDSDSRGRNRRQANRRSQGSSPRNDDRSASDDSRSPSIKLKGNGNQRSRSRSSSASSSRSRTSFRNSTTREDEGLKRKPKVSQRRDSTSSGTSCDKHSEGSIPHEKKHADSGHRDATCNQAWSVESKPRNDKQYDSDNEKRRSSADKTIGKGSRKQRSRGRKHSPVHTDSDMTDVSQISSPRNSCQTESNNKLGAKPPKCLMRAPGVKGGSEKAHRDGGDNALELNLLMKAVSELEKQTRVQSNTRRVMFDSSGIRRELKPNYTFCDSDTHRIEQENKRLLRQIMCQMHSMDGRYFGSINRGKQSVMAASGINRLRDHHRIEKENLALLKRLHQIKPSKGISRQEQLSAYNSTLLYGVPVTTMHNPPASSPHISSKSRSGSETGSLGRTRSLTSVQSAATTSSLRSGQSGCTRSQPSSAKMSLRQRPLWDDRW